MNIGAYGILIIFGAFVLLMVLNPNLSCFGKRLKSPLYPLLRKRGGATPKKAQTEDYGFDLGGHREKTVSRPQTPAARKGTLKTEDYGFDLHDPGRDKTPKAENEKPGKGSED